MDGVLVEMLITQKTSDTENDTKKIALMHEAVQVFTKHARAYLGVPMIYKSGDELDDSLYFRVKISRLIHPSTADTSASKQ